MLMARDALVMDPGISSQKLSKADIARTIDDAEVRHSTMLASNHRGTTLHVAEGDAAAQWASVLENVSFKLKFVLNAGQDTLPHNANLSLLERSS